MKVKRGLSLTNTSPGVVGVHDLAEAARRQAGPLGDDQNPVGARGGAVADRRRTRRPARGTAPARPASSPSSGRCRRGRSANRTSRVCARRHVQRRARRAVARCRDRARAAAWRSSLRIETDDLRAFGDPDQRRRHGERLADFAERLDLEGRTGRAFRLPAPGARRAARASGCPPRAYPAGCRLSLACTRGSEPSGTGAPAASPQAPIATTNITPVITRQVCRTAVIEHSHRAVRRRTAADEGIVGGPVVDVVRERYVNGCHFRPTVARRDGAHAALRPDRAETLVLALRSTL